MGVKKIKIFPNNDEKSLSVADTLVTELKKHNFQITDSNYDLAIAVGGDGSYLRMVRDNNFSDNIYYIGVNTGTLGFLQEVSPNEIDLFLERLKNESYTIDEIGVQQTKVINKNKEITTFKSLNEMYIRDIEMGRTDFRVDINGSFLERFAGDGLLVCTTIGSTAYNRNLGGAIIYRGFDTLQLTPIAGDNSSAFKSLTSPIVFPSNTIINIIPERRTKDLKIFYDTTRNVVFNDVERVETTISKKRIKCLRMQDYDYAKIIQDKLLK